MVAKIIEETTYFLSVGFTRDVANQVVNKDYTNRLTMSRHFICLNKNNFDTYAKFGD